MSVPNTSQLKALREADRRVDDAAGRYGGDSHSARLDVLEAVASRIGGFDLAEYRALAPADRFVPTDEAWTHSGPVVEALRTLPIEPAFSLASLATPPLSKTEQRTEGVYYTDARLARYLAAHLPTRNRFRVLDPAAGTGILLVAAVLRACGKDASARAEYLRECVFGADLSSLALRGASLSLASLTSDLGAVRALLSHLRVMDSLRSGMAGWVDLVPEGFDAVIGNPPWEKLRVTRHEVLRAEGVARHYGETYDDLTPARVARVGMVRTRRARYSTEVLAGLELQGSGESDLYKVFLEFAVRLIRPGGSLAYLIPAGLIRSQGTEGLRRFLFEEADRLEITVHDNRARHFAIDTRFKFLSLHAVFGPKRSNSRSALRLNHASATEHEIERSGSVDLARSAIARFRSDLAVPELRNRDEWDVLRQMVKTGRRFGDPDGAWKPRIVREVDMTGSRSAFTDRPGPDSLPVVEGRMVHQYRFGAKAYASGSGRKAVWHPVRMGAPEVTPQFWIDRSSLRPDIQTLTGEARVGFCDVTGQTNERSLLCARIPAGVVCGNKVPTIVFGSAGEDPERQLALGDLWLGIANSIPFDWMLRRVLTTSVNFFLLLDLPLPDLDFPLLPAQRIAALSRALTVADRRTAAAIDLWTLARKRAEIDVRVLAAYELDRTALVVMLEDFPLLDRGQPPLDGEMKSTITRDFLLATYDDMFGTAGPARERVRAARRQGAIPYVPSEYVLGARSYSLEEAEHG